ncbi:hypothetical protein DM02DRAFT_610479 [Periconia macrospinosa]|uniref:Uncharacterized protein n=1 Tax=Periconia macrospinosa TaxID=97972 RepID=A0A2V1E5C5_9PLEO|nr:hypothetical protein DM02DRAFT_610479 [Periconia macrospinosa]
MQYLSLLSILLLTSTPHLTHAWSPSDHTCKTSSLCLTSFQWCNPQGRDCGSPPPNVYPSAESGRLPSLIWEREYEVTWNMKLMGSAVTIQWTMQNAAEINEGGGNGTRHRDWNNYPLSREVVWEYNMTSVDSKYTFRPSADMFPNPLAPNINASTARQLALGQTQLMIMQRRFMDSTRDVTNDTLNRIPNDDLSDRSQEFYVSSQFLAEAVKYAQDREIKAWRTKLGLGVGLGVGLTWIVVGCAWCFRRRRNSRQVGKGGRASENNI